MLDVDLTSEIAEPADETADGLRLVVTREVIGAEITVRHPVVEHVVGRARHRGGDGKDGLPGTPAHAAVTMGVFSQGAPLRRRVERRLPALASLRGQRPAHDTRGAALGKRVVSTPISATITWATPSLTPGIVISSATPCGSSSLGGWWRRRGARVVLRGHATRGDT